MSEIILSVVYAIAIILIAIGCSCIGYDLGVKDTEKAYKNKKCDKCSNYKTNNCPNSSKCHSILGKPYFKI